MRVLVACEFSGIVRDAFLARGHDAVSCDLLPTESPGPHVQGDVLPLLGERWDLVVAHPPCTYLSNVTAPLLLADPCRRLRGRIAAFFFRACLDANAPRVAVENPTMLGFCREWIGRGPDFAFQPWQYGDAFQKRTCFWLRGLPPLFPARTAQGPLVNVHDHGPSSVRGKTRSVFFPGVAAAMADQWGSA